MKKTNPNPTCLACGKPTKTLSNHLNNDRGHVIVERFITRCNDPLCSKGCFYHGEGSSIKEARKDYGLKYDKNFNEIKVS